MPELRGHSVPARLKPRDDPITLAYRLELEKHRLAAELDLARLRQQERSARRCDRRRDTALAVATLLSLLSAIVLPGPVYLLLALLWLRASVLLQRQGCEIAVAGRQ